MYKSFKKHFFSPGAQLTQSQEVVRQMHLHMKTVGFMLHLAGRPTCDREHTAPASFGYADSVVLESPVRSLLRINLPNDSRPLLSKFIRSL